MLVLGGRAFILHPFHAAMDDLGSGKAFCGHTSGVHTWMCTRGVHAGQWLPMGSMIVADFVYPLSQLG